MTVLTKTKKHYPRPRCEAITIAGQRCKFHGLTYIDGKCLCRSHGSAKAI